MSLVNDALKRAKAAQQRSAPPPPSSLQFQPLEPGQPVRQGLGLILPVTLAVLTLLVVVLVWQWAQGHQTAVPHEARAVTRAPAQTTAASQPASTPAAAPVPATASETTPPPQTDPHSALAAKDDDTPAATESSTSASATLVKAQPSDVTNTAAIVSAPPPKPAPLRLQAIVFNPNRPSALISGKTLFIGDKLGDCKVVAIDRESATLVGAGKTNVLSMPE